MQLIHYYVQRGFDWNVMASLPASEKIFLRASMEVAIETEAEKYRTLLGGG